MKTRKYSVLLSILLISYYHVHAQSAPEALLAQLPGIPNVNCAADTSEINRFSDRIYKVKEIIDQEIDRIHSNAQSDMEASKNKIMSDAVRQSGLSGNDLKKLQQSGGSKEQGRKAAEKVVMDQYNLSLQDLEKVGEMSDAEQEKWAQDYADKMMNQAKKDPEAAVKKGDKAKQLFDLASEQKKLGEYITERMTRVAGILHNVEIQDSIETRKLEEKIRPLEDQLCSGICTPAEAARSRAAEKQIYTLKIKFCEKMSPLLADAISQYQTTLKALLPDYRKLTDIQNEIVRLQQTGVMVPDDLSCYTAVSEYADVLSEAYRYWVGKFND